MDEAMTELTVMATALLALIALARIARQRVARKHDRRRPKAASSASAFRPSLHQRKPECVRGQIIRLRAWSPDLGCRKIAEAWSGRERATGTPRWMRVCDGEFAGWHFPP